MSLWDTQWGPLLRRKKEKNTLGITIMSFRKKALLFSWMTVGLIYAAYGATLAPLSELALLVWVPLLVYLLLERLDKDR